VVRKDLRGAGSICAVMNLHIEQTTAQRDSLSGLQDGLIPEDHSMAMKHP
jgi:hypothetical protein